MMVPVDENGNGERNEMTGKMKTKKEKAAEEDDNDKNVKVSEPDNVRKLLECSLCQTNDIPERHRLKHHTKFHPKTPYQDEFYIFTKATQKMFQCKACDVILIEPKPDEHPRTYHPMFKMSTDLFESLLLVDDPMRGEQKWIGNKDESSVNCHRCKHQFHKNVFIVLLFTFSQFATF